MTKDSSPNLHENAESEIVFGKLSARFTTLVFTVLAGLVTASAIGTLALLISSSYERGERVERDRTIARRLDAIEAALIEAGRGRFTAEDAAREHEKIEKRIERLESYHSS